MSKFINLLRDSAQESKKIHVLTTTALLIALHLVLDRFRIQLTPELRISVSFLALSTIGALFGPIMAMSAAFITDLISYFLNPQIGSYFPGYTITAVLSGFLYGLILYKKKFTLLRAFSAKISINIFCYIGLNTIWSSMLFGNAIQVILPMRVVKNLVLLPFETFLLFIVIRGVLGIYNKLKPYS